MSKTTGALAPVQSPLQTVRGDLAEAVDQATPAGALRAGIDRLEALAAEHPEFELSIAGSLKNLTEELTTLAAAPGGGPRIAERLRRLENELRARVARSPLYKPTPQPRESAFGPSPQPGPMAGRYPWLDPSNGLPR